MKNLKSILFLALLTAGMLVSCGRNNNQSEGAADSSEPAMETDVNNNDGNMGPGTDTDTISTSTDTVQGTTTNGNSTATGSGGM